jgi:phage shock protein PspC (stress-responsive transcriptional regulator)
MFFALIAGLFLGLIALAIAFPGLAGFLFSLYIIWIIIDENSKKGKITN